MAKRDYYEVLGVDKNASEDEIKRHTAKSPSSITPTAIRATGKPKRSLRKQPRLTTYCMTPKSANNMISSDSTAQQVPEDSEVVLAAA